MKETTIAAISTGLTDAGISVIRISGEEAIPIAQKVFRSVNGKQLDEMSGYTCALGKAVQADREIDECIATVFRAPKSYTGEDVVELSCHGGVIVTRDILRAVIAAGAEPASAGEFTKRAFLNGKMDLIEAESVMNIISARSSDEVDAAHAVKEGHISHEINRIKDSLMNDAAHLSAWADYPEEDIPYIDPQSLRERIEDDLRFLNRLLQRYDAGKTLYRGIDTVIVGKPNVGKSTLMNLLAGLDRSIVTAIPGTTRDTIEEQIQLGNLRLNLIDTAGIRDTEDEVEKIGVERARQKLEYAQVIFLVLDVSKPLDDDDDRILAAIPDKTPVIVFCNKTDLGFHEECSRQLNPAGGNRLGSKNVIFRRDVALKDRAFDLSEIERLFKSYFLGKDGSYATDVISYNERQHELIRKACRSLDDICSALAAGVTMDAVTVLIEDSVSILAQLTGENVTEEIVDRVFHNFCVGK